MQTDFTPLASLFGGALIGLAAGLLAVVAGRIAGISGLVRETLNPVSSSSLFDSVLFLLGLAAATATWLSLGYKVELSMPSSSSLLAVAGLLVGFGAVLGGGCTSGHGVCGLARFSKRSIAATVTFMSTAALTVYALRHLSGGWPWG